MSLAPAGSYVTTYVHPWHEEWCARTRRFDVREGRLASLVGLLGTGGPAILHGAAGVRGGYVDLIAAAVRARRWPVLLADATWEPGTRVMDRIARIRRPVGFDAPPRLGRLVSGALIRALDCDLIHYGVLSTHELSSLPAIWGVDAARVHFTPFCTTAEDLDPAPGGRGIMASGDSLRDYRPLVRAAAHVRAPMTIATSLRMDRGPGVDLTIRHFPFAEHEARLRAAAVVVVTLLDGTGRSAGQQTYLNAMAWGKPVIVTDAPGVRDYVRDGETGLVVANDSDALAEAANRLIGDRGYARRLGAAAREAVLDAFTPRHYVDRLLALADRITADGL